MSAATGAGADPAAARRSRIERVRARMAELGVDALLLSLGADLPWLSGYEAMPLERLTMLVLPSDDDATMVVPQLEASRVRGSGSDFSLRPWRETEDPVAIVASLVGARRELAVSDRCWAAPLLGLQKALPVASWRPASQVVGGLRAVKDDYEIAALQAAGTAADRVAEALLAGEIRLVGRTESEVSEEISARLREAGHAKVNFAIVGSGPNSASPHHEPGRRVIGEREPVVCDFGGALRLDDDEVGYCSDITRTVVTGEPEPLFVELYEVLQEAQAEGVRAAATGTPCEGVDAAGRAVIDAAGFGEQFIHRIGHGIGIEEHEDPYIVAGNRTPLVAGHAFSVEPGIYLAGRYGARIEDIVVATDEGPLSCNNADHSLHVVAV